ncbi:MAG: transcriptional repressor LexA [Sphaerochaetaceae bacterium]|nr:transcriptional repressor LexA [Sphaerochaetaceae bacterium]
MAKDLTKAQRSILSFISTYITEKSTSPSVREIADNFSISSAGVWSHLKALEKKNCLSIEPGQARGIRILKEEFKPELLSKLIPLYELSTMHLSGFTSNTFIKFPSTLLDNDKEFFALKMTGPDMKNVHIVENDLLIFEKTDEQISSSIVLARPDTGSDEDQIMIRRLEKNGSNWTLVPECDSIGATNCQRVIVYGILSLVVRNYGR